METKLTKEADKLLAVMYKEYLARRKEGQGKSAARCFDEAYLAGLTPISAWSEEDTFDAINELGRKGFAKVYINGSCMLTEDAVAMLEDRFVDGLKEVAQYIMQLIP